MIDFSLYLRNNKEGGGGGSSVGGNLSDEAAAAAGEELLPEGVRRSPWEPHKVPELAWAAFLVARPPNGLEGGRAQAGP